MSKHRLEIDELQVTTFAVSDFEATTADVTDASCGGTCNAWCTIIAACPSWTVCDTYTVNVDN